MNIPPIPPPNLSPKDAFEIAKGLAVERGFKAKGRFLYKRGPSITVMIMCYTLSSKICVRFSVGVELNEDLDRAGKLPSLEVAELSLFAYFVREEPFASVLNRTESPWKFPDVSREDLTQALDQFVTWVDQHFADESVLRPRSPQRTAVAHARSAVRVPHRRVGGEGLRLIFAPWAPIPSPSSSSTPTRPRSAKPLPPGSTTSPHHPVRLRRCRPARRPVPDA